MKKNLFFLLIYHALLNNIFAQDQGVQDYRNKKYKSAQEYYDLILSDDSNNRLNESLAAYSFGPTFSFFTGKLFNFQNEVIISPTLSLINLSTSFNDQNFNYQVITPGLHLSNYIGLKNIIPKIDLVLGLSFDINFLKLERKNAVTLPSISTQRSVDNPYALQASVILGIQINQ